MLREAKYCPRIAVGTISATRADHALPSSVPKIETATQPARTTPSAASGGSSQTASPISSHMLCLSACPIRATHL